LLFIFLQKSATKTQETLPSAHNFSDKLSAAPMPVKKTGIKHDQKVILKTRYYSGSCYVAVQRKHSLQKGSQNLNKNKKKKPT